MVTIATFSDIPEMRALINSVYRGESGMKSWTTEAHLVSGERISEIALREMMTKPGSFFLLYHDEHQLIGSVYLEKQGNTCYLGMISVATNSQQNGLGKKMLADCERFAVENLQCTSMRMTVIHQRTELISYYGRRGYELSGDTEPFEGDGIFGKPLRRDIYLDVLTKRL